MIRNGVLMAVFLGSMAIWITQGGLRTEVFIVVGIELGICALAAWRFTVGLKRYRDVSLHPVLRDFAPQGNALALARQVEEDVASGKARLLSDVVFTDQLIIKLGWFHEVVRLDDVAWAYVKQTSRSVNFIPVGTTQTLEVFTSSIAHRWTAMVLSANTDVFDAMRGACPNARFGYSLENEAWWHATRLELRSQAKDGAPSSAGHRLAPRP
jgi:hypothetical protein